MCVCVCVLQYYNIITLDYDPDTANEIYSWPHKANFVHTTNSNLVIFDSFVGFSLQKNKTVQKLFLLNSRVIFKAGVLINKFYCACFLLLFSVLKKHTVSMLAYCNKIQVLPKVFFFRKYFHTKFLAKDCIRPGLIWGRALWSNLWTGRSDFESFIASSFTDFFRGYIELFHFHDTSGA